MRLFVFGYPLHYHILQLAIDSACRYIDNITDVTVIWDDVGFKRLQPLDLSNRLQSLLPDVQVIKIGRAHV